MDVLFKVFRYVGVDYDSFGWLPQEVTRSPEFFRTEAKRNKSMSSWSGDVQNKLSKHNISFGAMVQQWFSLYTEQEFLAPGWKMESPPGLVCAILFSVVLSIVFECTNYAYYVFSFNTRFWRSKRRWLFVHTLLTGLRTLSSVAAYVAMLCVMTYNVWILISVIIGAAVGHFICRPFLYMSIQKHMQSSQKQQKDSTADTAMTKLGISIVSNFDSPEDEDKILQESRFPEILLDENL